MPNDVDETIALGLAQAYHPFDAYLWCLDLSVIYIGTDGADLPLRASHTVPLLLSKSSPVPFRYSIPATVDGS